MLAIVFVALIAVLQYRLWVGEGSFAEVHELRQATARQEQENQALRQRNRALEAEVRDLRTGLEAIEERARSELGMIKEGETFFQVVEPREGPDGGGS